jgi:hypothetical protein
VPDKYQHEHGHGGHRHGIEVELPGITGAESPPQPLPKRPKIRPYIDVIDVGDDMLAYDGVNNEIHFLSPSAGVVLQLCDGTATIEQTAAEVAEAYGAPLEVVERDVRTAVEKFGRQGLLEEYTGDLESAPGEVPDVMGDERDRIRMQVPRSS